MQALVAVLMVPLMLLNFFGGIGSGIWLAILGEWWAIGYGIVALFSPLLLGLLMMPGIIFAGPAVLLAQKGKTILAFPLLLLSQLYTYAIVAGWCLFVFYVFMSRSNQETSWPLLIWSYGVALGPWIYMTQKEQESGGSDGSVLTTFCAQIAYLIMAAVLVFGRPTLIDLVIVFCGVMLVGMLIQAGIAVAMLREERRLGMS